MGFYLDIGNGLSGMKSSRQGSPDYTRKLKKDQGQIWRQERYMNMEVDQGGQLSGKRSWLRCRKYLWVVAGIRGHWVGYKKGVDRIYWGTRCGLLTGWVEDLMGRVRDSHSSLGKDVREFFGWRGWTLPRRKPWVVAGRSRRNQEVCCSKVVLRRGWDTRCGSLADLAA